MTPPITRFNRVRGSLALAAAAGFLSPLLIAGTPQPAQSATTSTTSTVVATADTYLDSTLPTRSLGTRSTLNADGSPLKDVLVKFTVPNTAGEITSMKVRISSRSSNRTLINLTATTNSWSESSTSWANAPAAGTVIATAGPAQTGQWLEFTVPVAAAGSEVSYRLQSPGATQVSLNSRESGGATAPQLVVQATTPTTPPSSEPIRAAFYYPWFPEAWNQKSINPYTYYTPSRGYYDSRSTNVINGHIDDMLYAGLDAGISSWWGQGTKEDVRFPQLLSAAQGKNFAWTLYHEQESLGDPTIDQLKSDLAHIDTSFASHPNYLHVDGKPVLFVYADPNDGCDMVQRWTTANAGRFNLVLKVFSGYRTCATQPYGWHQYAPAKSADSQGGYSYSVSPGFWLRSETSPRLPRDLAKFESDVAAMSTSGAQFQLVTSFNEWGEGTSVESAQEWASSTGRGDYLDILHKYLADPGTVQPSTAPVVAAVGDIACDPASSSFNGGQGTSSSCRQLAVANTISGINGLTNVLALGDLQYESGTLSAFNASYDLSFGRFKSITKPVPGNHEYQTSGAAGYYDYFGPIAGDRTKGYYSYNVGSWHVVALNSNCTSVGGCGVGSAQLNWLKADLAVSSSQCTLAYWHHPLFSSGSHGNNPGTAPMWDALQAAKAELVLGGHDHHYERFAAQTSTGVASVDGLQSFVVGTGGKNHYALATPAPNSLVSNTTTYGALQLTLRDGAYDWKFVGEPGSTFTDQGTATCH